MTSFDLVLPETILTSNSCITAADSTIADPKSGFETGLAALAES